jgi:hypothetical protein
MTERESLGPRPYQLPGAPNATATAPDLARHNRGELCKGSLASPSTDFWHAFVRRAWFAIEWRRDNKRSTQEVVGSGPRRWSATARSTLHGSANCLSSASSHNPGGASSAPRSRAIHGSCQLRGRTRIIDELAANMVELTSGSVTLDGAVCSGEYSTQCRYRPRAIYPCCRVVWLQPIDRRGSSSDVISPSAG